MKDDDVDMKPEYDFSKGVRNPFARHLTEDKLVTLVSIDDDEVINFFKSQSQKSGIPYQTLINRYLKETVKSHAVT